MHKRRILITGASDLLGLNLALELAKDNHVFGHVHTQHLVSNSFEVIQGDLLASGELQRLLDETKPEWIVHCAALANVDACESDPLQAEQLNTEIPKKLARYVARGGARLLHGSTDTVFDGKHGGYSEEDKPNPLSVYAHTKLQGEKEVAREDPKAIIARVNLFGWSLSGNRSLAEFFFNNLRAGKQVMGFTDVFFCPILAIDGAIKQFFNRGRQKIGVVARDQLCRVGSRREYLACAADICSDHSQACRS